MTGTTTQIMLDLADLIHGSSAQDTAASRARLKRMSVMVAVFALGCGVAALLHVQIGVWSFALPPIVALASLAIRESASSATP